MMHSKTVNPSSLTFEPITFAAAVKCIFINIHSDQKKMYLVATQLWGHIKPTLCSSKKNATEKSKTSESAVKKCIHPRSCAKTKSFYGC